MAENLRAKLDNPQSGVNMLMGGNGFIHSALTSWTVGDWVHNNGKDQGGFLKRLVPPPPEIWAIRVTFPQPQVRIFGRFAEQDTFIALDMHTRGFLGKKGSSQWRAASSKCATDWATLFPNQLPHQGTSAADYISENYDEFILP